MWGAEIVISGGMSVPQILTTVNSRTIQATRIGNFPAVKVQSGLWMVGIDSVFFLLPLFYFLFFILFLVIRIVFLFLDNWQQLNQFSWHNSASQTSVSENT